MVIPAWMIRGPDVPGRVRAAVVLGVVLMAAAVATIRLHWLFIARVQPHDVTSVRRQAAPWLWRFEWGMTIVLLLAAQVAAAADHLLPAAVLLTMAVSGRLAMWFIEPATVRSALGAADE